MKEPSGRRWLVGAVGLFLALLVVWFAAAMRITASAAAPSSLMSSLRSRLTANYEPDPAGTTLHSLRLSIFEEVLEDLGMSNGEAASQSHEIQEQMRGPVPTATARDFQGAKPLTATPTETLVPTSTSTPTPTLTKTPRPTATKTPKPTATKKASGSEDEDPPVVTSAEMDVTVGGCTATIELSADIYDPPESSGIKQVQVKYKVPGYVDSYSYLGDLAYCSGDFNADGSWEGCYEGEVTFDEIKLDWNPTANPGPDDFEVKIYVKPIDNLGQLTYYYAGDFSISESCDDG